MLPPVKKLAFMNSPPARNTQKLKALRRGKATSRAPIISGTRRLKKTALSGITTRKIIVVPCIVNRRLYWSAFSTSPLAVVSCSRISSASTPPRRKKAKAVTPYMMPMRL